jgi:ferredoxin--NADP+ reductase
MSDSAPAVTATFAELPLVWRHEWNPGLLSFRIRREAGYRFTPGQFARIGLRKENGETIWRAYSIASGPSEPHLEFFLVVLPGGEFSSRVAKLDIGAPMLVEPHAQGFLTLDRFRDGSDLWLIATGTGLAPYISMLRDDTVWHQFERIIVTLSVRESRDLAYVAELEALAARHAVPGEAKLTFLRTLTRSTEANALHGRVTTLAETGELERAAGVAFDDDRSRFMLCGNPEMVEAMRALLKSRGFRMNRRLQPGHIIVENYW